MNLLEQAAIFLVTAVIVVPLFRRMQLGAVLGYLAAGAIIGPWGLGLIADADATLNFAEMGVVLLLFLIGLELEPWSGWDLPCPPRPSSWHGWASAASSAVRVGA